MPNFRVFTRWRGLTPAESSQGEIKREHNRENATLSSVSIAMPSQCNKLPAQMKEWTSGSSMTGIFEMSDSNKTVFDAVMAPILPQVLQGKSCNVFAYGHSGSGKTHTIIGYNYEAIDDLGLCLATARQLVDALNRLNEPNKRDPLGVGVRIYELRRNSAYDLLNDGGECFVREGPDGQVYIRGKTEMLENGKVRVKPIVTKACWSFEDLSRELQKGLKFRATGMSSVHDQSSRTHAVIELEIVTKTLLVARDAVIERESELVPIGKYATDVYIEEQSRAVIRNSDGGYAPNPEYQVDQARIDAVEAKKAEFESFVESAKEHESQVFDTIAGTHACLGGKLVFVDLAGSEYYNDKGGPKMNQSAQEKQVGRHINTDLLALKEVIRARAQGSARIPFRSSPLTMVLRPHFQNSEDSHSAMILTVSPASSEFAATMNTLKYGNMVGAAGSSK
ncbi:hypothetical protein N7508_008559 [Penicillium antarcticum]|uniref:uncharacterized protein n=1 Tax=Penicillium antarcticum TaxID=416450 RepID=UPI0023849A65|nr:uncharacterized protein N7508_008559 [Penicillium antarcticum]KAJ5293738.1 hypothetical protein N7508_008559 [Penicillium antarcticum]